MYDLPANLPVPVDDGRARHLEGATIPAMRLPSTNGGSIDLGEETKFVLFCYPMTGQQGVALPQGWDEIPGARGCTPEACRFRDLAKEYQSRGWRIFGMSVQSPAYQRELAERIHAPYEFLSDEDLGFTTHMNLPTLVVNGMTLLARMTLIVHERRIAHVFYPVFPPDTHADDVLAWIDGHAHTL